MEENEILQLLRENNKILKEILAILKKNTDPEFIKKENDNDFFMNVIANIVAKKLEDKYKL